MAYVSTNFLLCAQVIPTLINPMTALNVLKEEDMNKKNKHFPPGSLERQGDLLEDKLCSTAAFLNEEHK